MGCSLASIEGVSARQYLPKITHTSVYLMERSILPQVACYEVSSHRQSSDNNNNTAKSRVKFRTLPPVPGSEVELTKD